MTKLRWAFNSATVMRLPWEEELKLWQRFGWSAAEIWYDKAKARLAAGQTLEQLARQMEDAGVTPIGLCAGVIQTRTQGHDRNTERDELARRMDLAAALNTQSITLIVLGKVGDDLAAEYDDLIDPLTRVAEMAADRRLRVNLEFLGGLPINGTLGSCMDLVRRVNHPALGLLFDLCHYYTSASHIEELGLLPKGKLFLVHVDDAQKRPMERLANNQRCFPGEGRMDVPDLLNRIRAMTGYTGYFSVELYDEDVWKMDPVEVFERLARSIQLVEKQIDP